MRNIRLALWILLLALSCLWVVADPIFSIPYDFFALRSSLINYTGIISISAMSAAIILAARPILIEPYLGGLDKMYRLHRWLGITSLVFAVTHWLLTQAPKWMVGLGLLERPARRAPSSESASAVLAFVHSQRGLAESLGEWAFYAAVALIVVALVKWFPYRYFFRIHRLLALAYLCLVFHSLMLMKWSYWDQAIAPLLAVLMVAGSAAAIVILLRKVGQSRKAVGVVVELGRHPDLQVLEVAIELKGAWRGHQAGQFCFVSFDEKEGPHPFTITSTWKGDGRLRFVIKDLGDYTKTLLATLRVGDPVNLEGPYGQFTFRSDKPRQIWIGGGIGITPFIARMKTLAEHPDGKIIDLFHTTAVLDDDAIDRLRRDAHAAGVTLHLLLDARDGFLNVARICQAVPEWTSSDLWFCGPAGFGKALRRDFCRQGLPAGDFHQELFELR